MLMKNVRIKLKKERRWKNRFYRLLQNLKIFKKTQKNKWMHKKKLMEQVKFKNKVKLEKISKE